MDSHDSAPTKRRRSPYRTLTLAIFLVVATILLGGIGGVSGFVLLSHSDSRPVVWLRGVLHINSSGVTIPVHQAVTLQESSAIIDAARKVSPAVVAITTTSQVNGFFTTAGSPTASGGSGFILTSDGQIVTSKHLVSQSGGVKVVLSDGRIFDAIVQATDPLSDLAILKVEAKDLPTVELGASSDLQTGQAVMALGNPLTAFSNPLTFGVVTGAGRVSATGTSVGTPSERLIDFIQTDAMSGQSTAGGPLVNIAGQVVGLDVDQAPSGAVAGFSYALPIDSLKPLIDGFRKTGQITRPSLGLSFEPVSNELQHLQSLPLNYGLLINSVTTGGPAALAGVLPGDILTEVNGERIDGASMDSLNDRLAKYKVGDILQLRVLRDGAYQTLKATLVQVQ